MTLEPVRRDIVRRLFILTADENYIMARHAFFLGAMYDFYWLSMHAMEKYYKAIVLLNGGASPRTHDLVDLHTEVIKLEPRLPIGTLTKPDVPHLEWSTSTFDDFLEKVSKIGSADNRYGIYGYSAQTDTIFKVDQLVWALRRCCRPFLSELPASNGTKNTIDEVQMLIDDPQRWSVNPTMPLEKLINRPKENQYREEFLRMNIPFSGGVLPDLSMWQFNFQSSPISELYVRLTESTDYDTKSAAADTLDWVADNIVLSKEDKKDIKAQIAAHRATKAHTILGKAN